ncbi:MAG: hypothetical protein RBT49_16490 [Bacteroidales bacterium]|jgi:hypothetical protein|nr:hypothetical protein [Bacteroidales bacterium]
MKIPASYSETYEVKINVNPDLYIDSFRKRVQEQLRIIEARSEIHNNNTILFKGIVRYIALSGKRTLRILREGSIRIEKHGSNRIKIIWEIKTDSLLFMSVVSGLVAGLMFGFAGSTIILSIIFGLVSFSIVFFVGYGWIGA